MTDEPKLSIVMPVYNEAGAVGSVIKSIRAAGIAVPHEIIVVDDGSSDGTGAVVEKIANDVRQECRIPGENGRQECPTPGNNFNGMIRVIRHDRNRGYGAALKTGITSARAEAVMIIDGDGSYPVKHFDEFFALSAEHDMVVGARTTAVRNEPKLRTWVKALIIWMLKVLADIHVPDLNSGLRLMKRSQVSRYFHLLPDGISFTSTITLILLSEGRPVKFVPIDYFARTGASKFLPVRDTMGIIILIARTFLYFNPLKVFLPLSLAAFLLAGLVALLSILSGKFMDVTTVVLLLSGMQLFILGLLADLIAKRRS